jgi:DNA polymerase-1
MPEDLVRQIAPLHELIRAQGWPLLMVDGVEADDVIGTLVRKAEAGQMDCIISTGDKDLAQLISPRITLVNTMSNEVLDEQSVVDKFGVRSDQVLDLLTLTGDAVDNVPGVAKVGPKTAAKWLAQYGTLDNIVAHAGDIGGVVGENLRAALAWLPHGKKLLTIKTDCDLPFGPADLTPQAVDPAKLKALYERFVGNKLPAKDIDAGSACARRAADARGIDGSQPRHRPSAAPVLRHYELVTDEAPGTLAAAIERAFRLFDTERPSDPMQASGRFVRDRTGTGGHIPAPCVRASWSNFHRARIGAQAMVRECAGKEGRAERKV